MAFLIDTAFDSGLSWVTTNGTRLDICSAEPTTYTQATATNTLGNDTVTTGAAENNTPDGRKVVVAAITAGSVSGDGTANSWALTDGASVLIATGTVTTPQVVTNGNTFTLDAIDIAIRDAT